MVPPIKEPCGWLNVLRLADKEMTVGSEWSAKELAIVKDRITGKEEIEKKKDIEKMHFIV